MHRFTRATLVSLACLAGLTAGIAPAAAADYPNRPVRWLIGFAAGGPVDIVARIMGSGCRNISASSSWSRTAPARAATSAASAINSTPDGYTMLFDAPNNAISTSLYKHLNYDFIRDTVPVASIMQLTNILVVSNAMPVKTVQEFIDYCKANPGKVSYASSGYGTSVHMSARIVQGDDQDRHGARALSRIGHRLSDIMSNKVQLIFDNLPGALEQARTAMYARSASPRRSAGPAYPISPPLPRRCRIRVGRLLRHLRAQGHAAGNRRNPQQGGRRSAARSEAGGAVERTRRDPEADDASPVRQADRGRDREVAQGGRIRRRFGGLSAAFGRPGARHCRIASHIVRGVRTVACRTGGTSAGPVAQWLEPAAHNGLVPGSSSGRPTSLRSRSE